MSELFVAPERKRLMVVAVLPKASRNAKGNSPGSKGSRARSEMASSISTAFIDHSTSTRNMAAEFDQLYFFRSNKSGPNEAGLN